jgi:hypothetical protein
MGPVILGMVMGLAPRAPLAVHDRAPLAVHEPGKIIADMAVMLTLGRDCLADVAVLCTQPELCGPVGLGRGDLLADLSVWRQTRRGAAAAAAAPAAAWTLAGDRAPGGDGSLIRWIMDATIMWEPKRARLRLFTTAGRVERSG